MIASSATRVAPVETAMARRMVWLGLLAALLIAASCAQAQDRATLVTQGSIVFRDQGCYGCHTVGATGTPIAMRVTFTPSGLSSRAR